jgi:hypothetical protein
MMPSIGVSIHDAARTRENEKDVPRCEICGDELATEDEIQHMICDPCYAAEVAVGENIP